MTDPAADPDRRAWHRAQAAAGPDEEVAAELERSAGRAQARGGLAAAAAFLERVGRADRRSGAARRAHAGRGAGQPARPARSARRLELLATAGGRAAGRARRAPGSDLLRGQIAFASGLGSDAPPLLLKAAKRLEPLDLDLARETYLSAWMAALFAGRLAGAGDLLEVSRAARALPPAGDPPRPVDLLLDGLALLVTDGPAAAAPALRQARRAPSPAPTSPRRSDSGGAGWLRRPPARCGTTMAGARCSLRQVQLARDAGALDQLPIDAGRAGHGRRVDAVTSRRPRP